MRLVHELERLGGVARWRDLRGLGATEAEARRAVRAEQVLSPVRGVYALPAAPHEFVTAVARNGLLTCSSAATIHGLAVLHTPAVPHLAGHHLSDSDRAAVLHRKRHVVLRARPTGPPVVSPLDCVLDAARCLPFAEALVIADSALHRRLVVSEDLPRHPRGPHAEAVRRLRSLADGRAESPLETLARLAFVLAGWDAEPQVYFSEVGRVDLVVEGRVVVELDGDAYHSTPAALATDRRRGNELTVQGMPVLRFGYRDVVFDMERVVDTVRAVLSRSGTERARPLDRRSSEAF